MSETEITREMLELFDKSYDKLFNEYMEMEYRHVNELQQMRQKFSHHRKLIDKLLDKLKKQERNDNIQNLGLN